LRLRRAERRDESTSWNEDLDCHKELDDRCTLVWMPHIFSSSTSGGSIHVLDGLESIVDQDS